MIIIPWWSLAAIMALCVIFGGLLVAVVVYVRAIRAAMREATQ